MKITARLAAVAVAAGAVLLPALPANAAYPPLPVIQPKARVLTPGCPGPGNIIRERLNNSESTGPVTFGIAVDKGRRGGKILRYRTTIPAETVALVSTGRLVGDDQTALVIIRFSGSETPLARKRVDRRSC